MKILILYMPVLHEGYRRLLEKHLDADAWYLIGNDLAGEFTHVAKEIRQLPPEFIAVALRAWYPMKQVVVLTQKEVPEIQHSKASIVTHDEDVTCGVVEKYFVAHPVRFESWYLRRDRKKSLAEEPVVPDSEITTDEFHQRHLLLAEAEGQKSPVWLRQVGALAMRDGEVLIAVHNHPLPSSHTPYALGDPRDNFKKGIHIELSTDLHAEAAIVSIAASRKDLCLAGADVYVPPFPCPPCANSLAPTKIKRLFYRDGYTALEGADMLRAHGIEIIRVVFPEEKKAP